MTAPQKCDVCLTPHHKHQAHVFAKVAPVPIRTRVRHAVAVEASVDPAWVELRCEVCGDRFDARRSHAKTCSAKCRQAASRKRRG